MSSNNALPIVTGEIFFSPELSSFSRATLYIYLEDVSYMDAPAETIAKQVIPDISHDRGTENRLKFALKPETLNQQVNYSIRVHVSLHRDEEIICGDYITMESYPVLTFGYPNRIAVFVQEVK